MSVTQAVPDKDAKIRPILKNVLTFLEDMGLDSNLFKIKTSKDDTFTNPLITYHPSLESLDGVSAKQEELASRPNPILKIKIPPKEIPDTQHEFILDTTIGILFGLLLAPSNYVLGFNSATICCYIDTEELSKKSPVLQRIVVEFESDVTISCSNKISKDRSKLEQFVGVLEDLQKQSTGKTISSNQFSNSSIDPKQFKVSRLNAQKLEVSLAPGFLVKIKLNAYDAFDNQTVDLLEPKLVFDIVDKNKVQTEIEAKFMIKEVRSKCSFAALISNLDFMVSRLSYFLTLKLSGTSAALLGTIIPSSKVGFEIQKVVFSTEIDSDFLTSNPELTDFLSGCKISPGSTRYLSSLTLESCYESLGFSFLKDSMSQGSTTSEVRVLLESGKTTLNADFKCFNMQNTPKPINELPLLTVKKAQLVGQETANTMQIGSVLTEPFLIKAISKDLYRDLRTKSCPVYANFLLPHLESLYSDLVQTHQLDFALFSLQNTLQGISLDFKDLKRVLVKVKDQKSTEGSSAQGKFEFSSFEISKIGQPRSDSSNDTVIGKTTSKLGNKRNQLILKEMVGKTLITKSKWQSTVTIKSVIESASNPKSLLYSKISRLESQQATPSTKTLPLENKSQDQVYESKFLSDFTISITETRKPVTEDYGSIKYVLDISTLFLKTTDMGNPDSRAFGSLGYIRDILMPFEPCLDFKISKLVVLSKYPRKSTAESSRNQGNNLFQEELLIRESAKESDDSDASDDEFTDLDDFGASGKKKESQQQVSTEIDYHIDYFFEVSIGEELAAGQPIALLKAKNFLSMVLPDVAEGKFFEAFVARVKRTEKTTALESEKIFHEFDLLKNPWLIQMNADHYMIAYTFDFNQEGHSIQLANQLLVLANLIIKLDQRCPVLEQLSVMDSTGLQLLGIRHATLVNCYLDFFDSEFQIDNVFDPETNSVNFQKDEQADLERDADDAPSQTVFSRYLLYLDKYTETPNNKSAFLTFFEEARQPLLMGPCRCQQVNRAAQTICDHENVPLSNRPCLLDRQEHEATSYQVTEISKAKLYLMIWDYSKYRFHSLFPKMNLLGSVEGRTHEMSPVLFDPYKFGFSEVASLSQFTRATKFMGTSKLIDILWLTASDVSLAGTLTSVQHGVDFLFPGQYMTSYDLNSMKKLGRLFSQSPKEWDQNSFSRVINCKVEQAAQAEFSILKQSLFEEHIESLRDSFSKKIVRFSNLKIRIIHGEDFVADLSAIQEIDRKKVIELTKKGANLGEEVLGSQYGVSITNTGNSEAISSNENTQTVHKIDQQAMMSVGKMFGNRRYDCYFEFTSNLYEKEEMLSSKHGSYPTLISCVEFAKIGFFLKHGSVSPSQPFLESDFINIKLRKSVKDGISEFSVLNFEELPLDLSVEVDSASMAYVSSVDKDLQEFMEKVLVPPEKSDASFSLIVLLRRVFGNPSTVSNSGYSQPIQATVTTDGFQIHIYSDASGSRKTIIEVTVPYLKNQTPLKITESMFDVYKNYISHEVTKENPHLKIETNFKDYPILLNTLQGIKNRYKVFTKSDTMASTSKSMISSLKGVFGR